MTDCMLHYTVIQNKLPYSVLIFETTSICGKQFIPAKGGQPIF